MGHPMGATGAILITTLLNELEFSKLQKGMVVAQAGGGIGAAMLIERVN
jgi:acetyl-CoA C-acetyltransferase